MILTSFHCTHNLLTAIDSFEAPRYKMRDREFTILSLLLLLLFNKPKSHFPTKNACYPRIQWISYRIRHTISVTVTANNLINLNKNKSSNKKGINQKISIKLEYFSDWYIQFVFLLDVFDHEKAIHVDMLSIFFLNTIFVCCGVNTSTSIYIFYVSGEPFQWRRANIDFILNETKEREN